MQGLNKQILIPLLSALALIIKSFTGFELPDPSIDLIADGLLALTMIIGFFQHPNGEPVLGHINKALLLPIFGTVAMFVGFITHKQVPQNLVDALADVVQYALVLWGIFMHPTMAAPVPPDEAAPAAEKPPQIASATSTTVPANVSWDDVISRVQTANKELNYYMDLIDKGKVTDETREAITRYLQIHDDLTAKGLLANTAGGDAHATT